jgi:putative Mg2+ transporter-C (MgtC) family protein
VTFGFIDTAIRLVMAAVLGGAIGIDRELRKKPAGLRTHAMVSLGSSLLTIAGLSLSLHDSSAVSRVLQGLVAGIGFVGGGAILRSKTSGEVEGLTTATSVWVVAAIGIATGLGLWQTALTATVISLVLLSAGERLDQWLARLHQHRQNHAARAAAPHDGEDRHHPR